MNAGWDCKSKLFYWCGGGGEEQNKSVRTVNIFLAFFFLENYVLGTGFLGIPFAIFHSGLLYGAVTMIVITFVSWNCAVYTVESMARAQAIFEYKEQLKDGESSFDSSLPLQRPNFRVVSSRKFEPSELSEMFMGRIAKYVYLITYGTYTFASSLSYATVAGASWATEIPFNLTGLEQCRERDFKQHILPINEPCRNAYWLCLFGFACIVVPLSMLELKEQTLFQMLFGFLRFFTIASIIIYTIVRLILNGVISDCKHPFEEEHNASEQWYDLFNSSRTTTEVVLGFDWRGWMVAIPVMIYSHNLHMGIPSLSHPVREKRFLRTFFDVQFLLNLVMYLLLGVVVPLWYRNCISETITLNWGPLKYPGTPLPLRILAYFIVIFPSLDVCSIFPLVVLCMVNNIYLVLFGKDTTQANVGWSTIIGRMTIKFLCALTPILVAMAVSNLVDVLKYAGLLAFFTSLFFPPLFQISSQRVCKKVFGHLLKTTNTSIQEKPMDDPLKNGSCSNYVSINSTESTPLLFGAQSRIKPSELYMTPYSGVFSHPVFASILGGLGLVFFALSIASLFV